MDVGGISAKIRPSHPRATANLFSSLTFTWLIPIFYRGFKKEMETNDLFEVLPDHKSKILRDRFELEWNKEIRNAKVGHRQPKLLNVIIRIFFYSNCLYGFIVACNELVFRVLQPFFIGLLVRYFSVMNSELPEPVEGNATYFNRLREIFESPQTRISEEEAVFYAIAIALNTLISTCLLHPYLMALLHQGMQCRVGCCSLIYRKALRLSKTALGETTVGQVVNLLSNDVGCLDRAVLFIHYLWIAPVEAALVTYFLFPMLNWPTLVGVSFLVLQIPCLIFFGKKSSFYRLRTAIRTDERVRLMNEIVNGIQVIKMYAWEIPFAKLVAVARNQEMHEISGTYTIRGIMFSSFIFSSRIAIFLTIVGHALSGGTISADIIFIVTAFFYLLRNSMTILFPDAITQVAEAFISIKRLEKFLLHDEIAHSLTLPLSSFTDSNTKLPPPEIKFEKASFKWTTNSSEQHLVDLTVTIPPSSLLTVIGPVGAGKSTLIQAILKEVPISSGSLSVSGSISYASQEPWLFLGSIRQNILFGLVFNRQRYKRVIEICGLKRDLDLLPHGDRTIVGERGVSLSGGQRARINLARAVYNDADIYLLDDPLSAVDAHVGKHLFEDCISDFLADKIVILVTHQLQHLTNCDRILILNNGKTEAFGTFEELQASCKNFAKLLQKNHDDKENSEDLSKSERKHSISSSVSQVTEDGPEPVVTEEIVKVGSLGGSVYQKYFAACKNWFYVIGAFALLILCQVVSSVNDWWVSKWSKDEEWNTHLNKTAEQKLESTYNNIYIFAALNLGLVVIAIVRSLSFLAMCRIISRNLHESMFRRITCAPMKFFFDNPSGRILNRFSKDIGSIDTLLPETMLDCFQVILILISIVIICAVISPLMIPPTIVLCVIMYLLQIVYLRTSRNVKRLEAATRSPVFSHLNASMQGLSTIRAFKAQNVLCDEFDLHQDVHSSAWYLFLGCSRAFAFWLDILTAVYISFVCYVVLYHLDSGPDAGLAITQSLGLVILVQWGIRQCTEVENLMTSVERIVEYTQIEQEPPRDSQPEHKPLLSWPAKGKLKFENVYLRYNPLGEPVLNGISFSVDSCEKIGIVGRTGAGKSSLISALFRLAYTDGQISIDSVVTSTLGLHDLRCKISIIPQEPVLFSGTLRKNLDPFDEYPDWCLWNALEEVELKDIVSESPAGLHERMSEGGMNFSVGQRQLICLARAIVRNNKILIMDEATANVDPRTDMLIQNTIRRKFMECTVLTVAHRLNTVMDSDKILVMDAGVVAEFDHPYVLLKDEMSMLSGLVEQTGQANAKRLKSIAKKNYKLKLRRDEALRILEKSTEICVGNGSDSSRSSSPELPKNHIGRL